MKQAPIYTYIIRKRVEAHTAIEAIKGEKGRVLEIYEEKPDETPATIGFSSQENITKDK